MKKLLILLAIFGVVQTASAKIELTPIMGSNMVLQQKSDAKLWGKAKPNAPVSVTASWDNKKVAVKADAAGNWSAKVATPSAGGPYKIVISDGEALTLENILIGEVWIVSGQSNMEMPVIGFTNQPIDGSRGVIMNAAQRQNIRLFTVPRATSPEPLTSCGGEWKVSSAESAAAFSAVGYLFALRLQQALGDIPIGVINTSWGGTQIQPWMPKERSQKVMDDKYLSTNLDNTNLHGRMGYLYNAMINPIVGFTAKGFLWYQGESNRMNTGVSKTGNRMYASLMQEMVAQWRSDWGDTSNQMPFYFVEIAPYQYQDANAIERGLLVENQTDALKLIPNSGMAATTDIGHRTCIHPPQKDEVAERLVMLAMGQTYGSKGFPVGSPTVEKVEYKDGKARVYFTNLKNGLTTKSGNVIGFEIAGEDKVFHPANARIVDRESSVEVSSDAVKAPVAVRFGFRNYTEIDLYSLLMIPPHTFRTDNW